MKVGVIGLGAMGTGMARNLAKAGFLSGVYNRTNAKADHLANELATKAYATISDLAAEVELIISCVSADADVLEVVDAIANSGNANLIVVDASTVSRQTAQQAARLLAEHKIGFLDAPVSGGVEGANKGTLAMMVGGEIAILEQIRPALDAIAARILHLGEHGAGQACKAVNQIMAAGINQAVCEALAFADAQHLDLATVIEVVSGGAAGNWFLQHRGHTMSQSSFNPGFKLALHHKDLLICQQMAQQAEIPSPLTDTTLADYAQLIQQGHGNEDISALFRLKRKTPPQGMQ
ncbi:MAG: NAD(P)-dependent oxidoreductase [Methylomonas sp.]